jgi:Fe-S cluster assembly scaffold protein SufB
MSESATTTDIGTAPTVRGEISPETVTAIVTARGEPDWMAARRQHAWDVYRETPMPTTKDEEWRYTDLSKIDWQELAMRDPSPPVAASDRGHIPAEIQAALHLDDPSSAWSVDHNSTAIYEQIEEELTRQGVVFVDLAEAIAHHPQLVRKYFMTSAVTPEFGKLAALHGALVSGGRLLYVPAGVEIELPINAFHWLDIEQTALFPHTLVIAGPQSKVTYVEECASPARPQEGLAMNCGVTEIIAEEGANVRYAIVQEWGRHVFHYQAVRIFAHKDARCTLRRRDRSPGGGRPLGDAGDLPCRLRPAF